MKVLISSSSHRRYGEIIRDFKMCMDMPAYIPEGSTPESGIRKELFGYANEPLILMGTFYHEEYEYLASNNCKIYELSELHWGERNAKKERLQ